jgi:hypothetical protein
MGLDWIGFVRIFRLRGKGARRKVVVGVGCLARESRWAKTIPLDDLRSPKNYCQLPGVCAQTTLESRNCSAEGRLARFLPRAPAKAKCRNILQPKEHATALSLFTKLLRRSGVLKFKGLRQLQGFYPEISLFSDKTGRPIYTIRYLSGQRNPALFSPTSVPRLQLYIYIYISGFIWSCESVLLALGTYPTKLADSST